MKMFSLLAVVASLLLSSGAHAQTEPVGCKLAFHVKIGSFLIVSSGHGHGVITCANAEGKAESTAKVDIEIEGLGLGLGAFDLKGVSGSIGITDPRELTGTYAVAQANVGFGGAIGANLGFVGQENGLSFTSSVNAGRGIGAYLNGTAWTISLAR